MFFTFCSSNTALENISSSLLFICQSNFTHQTTQADTKRQTQNIAAKDVHEFLDIGVSSNFTFLTIVSFFKPSSSHSYLLYMSSNPLSGKEPVLYTQLLYPGILSSDNAGFMSKVHELLDFFHVCPYLDQLSNLFAQCYQ